jgi:hypothetical protein
MLSLKLPLWLVLVGLRGGLAGGSLVLGGFGLVVVSRVVIPVTQGWRGLAWQGWRRLSTRFSLEAGERETPQGCALARCVLRCA